MPNDRELPPHLRVFMHTWASCAATIQAQIKPVAPIPDIAPLPHDYRQLKTWAILQNKTLQRWSERLLRWINGSLADALADPAITPEAMQSCAGRVSGFAEELATQRHLLQRYATKPDFRGAVLHVDAIIEDIQQQLLGWIRQTLRTLQDAGQRLKTDPDPELPIELEVCFHLTRGSATQAYLRWLKRIDPEAETHLFSSDASELPAPPTDSLLSYLSVEAVLAIGAVVFGVVLWLVGGKQALIFLLLGILAVVVIRFFIRHPFLALLAFLFGSLD
ncbi:hypothetical protein [Sinimarinibacterium sp. NLF-5-8]|uniref:hypothetical protein n=1 Tax=Sinimarinibacterium sp. NLF-5-8 TaxID=2698684 RepID=UPI00137BC722|nr:hypothetical protein [Sinimarinibacterium sp. NLF-5-8]QHS09562.1 hypothetical protein GT972_04895 [Sinimarinibacterium sp. NLF-5-8]